MADGGQPFADGSVQLRTKQPPPLRRTSSFDRFIPFRPSLDLEGAHHKLVVQSCEHGTASETLSSPDTSNTFSSLLDLNLNGTNQVMQRAVDRSILAVTRSLSLDDAHSPRPSLEYKRRLSLALDIKDTHGAGSKRILPFSCHTPPPSPLLSPVLSNVNSCRSSDQWAGSPFGDARGGDGGRDSPGGLYTPPTPSRTPRKVVTEPDTVLRVSLRNDFYCSLMDWGRANTLGVGVETGAYIWNAATTDCQHIHPGATARAHLSRDHHPLGHVCSVRWDQTGRRLALGYNKGSLLVWDAGAMKVGQDMSVPKHVQLGCLCWWNNSLFCGTSSGRVYHFDLRDKSPLPTKCAPVHRGIVCNVQLSPDESTLACGGDDGIISVWEPRAKSVTTKLPAHKSGTRALAWCPWRRKVLASGGGTADGFIRIWSLSACAVKSEVDTGMQVCNVLWSDEYRELVSSHSSEERNEVLLWTARDWNLQLLARLHPPLGRPLHQCLSPDCTTLASASADDRLSLWKLFPKKRSSVFSPSPLNLDRAIR